jgi:phosphoglycolate phosphatase-like HAD superfamily hydrolase
MTAIRRLILLDIDGTLLRSQGVGRESTRLAMLEVFGTEARLASHIFGGKTDWQTLVELLAEHDHDMASIGGQMAAYETAIARHLTVLLTDSIVTPCPGAPEAVAALRSDPANLLGIVTGNVRTTAPLKLQAAGYDPAWFPVGAFGSEALDREALPALAIQRATEYSGVTFEPRDVWVVGDTARDISCARAVGARAVAVCTGFEPRDELIAAGPDHLLDDLSGLLDLLAD